MAANLGEWEAAQEWERSWWLNNRHLHPQEMVKNRVMADWMLIRGAAGLKVLDIGCGPLSLLLRIPAKEGVALDPLDFGPLEAAYRAANVRRVIMPAEEFKETGFDEVWVYNCLQHTIDPMAVLATACRAGRTVRLFEWTGIDPYQGHLHRITPEMIRTALSGHGEHTMFVTGHLNNPALGLHGDFCSCVYEKA
jgi:SAM-dependent methyltransferase